MPSSDDIKKYMDQMYTAPTPDFETTSIPDNTWDEVDTAEVGRKFFIGAFVQNVNTNALYRCRSATANNAEWTLIIQREI